MTATVEERTVDVGGLPTRYLTAGEGPPLVLLHGDAESAFVWSWVLPELARTHRVYAPDLPGAGGVKGLVSVEDYSPVSLERFARRFLDAVGIEGAAVVGNSLGGLVALRLALSDPGRVEKLGLVSSAGLGRAVTPLLAALTIPGYGDLVISWAGTRPGATQRAFSRVPLLFARPRRVPRAWLAEQRRLARLPGFLASQLAALRAQIGASGQSEVLLDRLPELAMPTLVLWGERDRVLPAYQAREAFGRLPNGSLELLPDCGHLPQVECPEPFTRAVQRFLG